jgi:hypothetical protein
MNSAITPLTPAITTHLQEEEEENFPDLTDLPLISLEEVRWRRSFNANPIPIPNP